MTPTPMQRPGRIFWMLVSMAVVTACGGGPLPTEFDSESPSLLEGEGLADEDTLAT